MAGTITTDLLDIDLAEAITNWLSLGTWGAAFAATPDIALQGTNDLWGRVTANFGMALAAVSSIDFTTGVHLFHFQKNICWPKAAVKSQGGMRLCISSDTTPTLTGSNPSAGATNSKSWYMGGSDTDFTTGWVCYVIDPTSTPDLTLGTCTTTSIKRAGVGAYITGSVGGGAIKPMNINFSAIRYGYGLIVKDGTGSAPADFPAVYTTDSSNTNSWGIVTAEGGVYYLAGKVNIGTTTQTALTVFRDTNQTLVYRNFPVSATFYEILVKGASSYKTTFRLGSYTPATGLASSGCTIKGSGTLSGTTHSIWILTASDSNQVTKLYACNFSEMRSAALAYNTVSPTVANCTTSNDSPTMTTTGSFDTSGVVVGMSITGTNIPASTYVSSIASATSLTMNQNATGNIGGTATFAHNNEIRGCTFSNFGTITTNGCVIDNTIFQDLKTGAPISATYALIVASTTEMGRITNCKFVNCNRAIQLSVADNYTFTGNTFSGNTYDIENSSAATNVVSTPDTRDTDQALGNGTITAVGQSFSGNGAALANVVFTLSTTATNPGGNLYSKIYASTGGAGSYVPTGSVLATSPVFDVNTLTTTPTATTIYFASQNQNITLSSGTHNYIAVLEYSGGNASNYVKVGVDSSPSYGNLSTYTSPTWTANGSNSAAFQLRTGGVITVTPASGSNPSASKVLNSNAIPGCITINTGVNIIIHTITAAQANINGAKVAVFQSSDLTTPITGGSGTTAGSGTFTVNTTLSVATALTVRVRLSPTGSTRYLPTETTTTVPTSETTLTMILTPDTIAAA